MGLKIKTKLILSALVMAVILMTSSAAIVSVIVGNQTKASIYDNLDRAVNLIKEELTAQINAMQESCRKTVLSNDTANEVKFLYDFPDKGSIVTTKSTFVSCSVTLFQAASSNNYSSMATYDIDGNLKTFVQAHGDGNFYAGFHMIESDGSGSFMGAELHSDERLTDDRFLENASSPDLETKIDLNDRDLSLEESSFFLQNGKMAIKIFTPLMGKKYNPETDSVEPTPVGTLISYYPMDDLFAERIKKMTSLDINIYVNGQLTGGTLKSYNACSNPEIKSSFKPGSDLIAQESYTHEFELDGKKHINTMLPVYEKTNLVGSIAVIQSAELIASNIKNMLFRLGIVNGICILLILPIVYIFSLTISNPLKNVVNRLRDIAEGEGDLTMRLEKRSSDEFGDLAHWFNIFIEKLQAIILQIANNAGELNRSSEEMANLSGKMSSNSEDMVSNLNETTVAVEGVNNSFLSVAAAMEQSSTNLNMIVSSSEEMAVTINEISRKTENATSISRDAVSKASGMSDKIKQLGDAAQEIGKVTDIINEISEQTNLLSLNATIEAARAGEAGKGFTVVAGEIKELAKQTAKATKGIKDQIEGIQKSAETTARDVEGILSVIHEVNKTIASIGSDIEEQSSTTQGITENVAHASQGVSEVSQNVANNSTVVGKINGSISNIDNLAHGIAESSSDVANGARSLFMLSETLDELVRKFKIK
ncbi:exported hypothetical protein [Desulfamplus magnetovallimortis]|uniref:Methyl-accepting chemotaxis protein n=1 Tax=Desulfamplus magnetovallimortis TaxID=1246637 RepID=A0A1W1HJ73_9BACT|nr:methyl-accepting chemotaxis protein [Desulfamplus magnetovallimortis]SLM32551.1 exported hypothetical protein [Desulfamplus magnetovallimortis]